MDIIIGSARISEKWTVAGNAGDQKQKTKPDYSGEVSMQKFYVDSRGWDVLRPKKATHAEALAKAMKKYCNDSNVGYSQEERSAIMSYAGKGKTNCDCSSLIRRCVKDATGKTISNFTTASEKVTLVNSGLFDYVGKYKAGMKLCVGDVLATCTKGHTVAVVEGYARSKAFPKYTGSASGIDEIFKAIGATAYYDTKYTNYKKRKPIATANGISNYSGTSGQNIKLKILARNGQLLIP